MGINKEQILKSIEAFNIDGEQQLQLESNELNKAELGLEMAEASNMINF